MPPLVSVISCALNQGDWVRKTIPLMRESLGDWPHEIIVVDDQSTDGCCTGLDQDVLIMRTDGRHGVSASRRLAARVAQGEILLFSDPHCQYGAEGEHALRDLVEAASVKQAICIASTTGLPRVKKPRYGGTFVVSDRGLKVGYSSKGVADWPVLLGTIYAVQRPVYDHLGGWPELPGVWGYSEQALSLMAWFCGVPIWVDTRHICNHQHYHPKDRHGGDKFAYRVPQSDQANNGHWVHAAFFPATYQHYWAPMLKSRFKDREEYWSCLRDKGFRSKDPKLGWRTICDFKREISKRAVRSEKDFFDLVLKTPMPRYIPPTDEEYVAVQRTRSKPGKYKGMQRRQSRAMDWFIGKVPGCIKGRSILDLGARDGYTVARFKEMGVRKVEGVELVPDTAKYAKERLKRNVVQGDMRHLPYEDNSWNMVTSIHSLEHLPDPENGVKEMLRVLMPGGWFLIVVPKESFEHMQKDKAHYVCWSTEESFVKFMSQFKEVDNVTMETKGLRPKGREEILLAGRKKRK